ncbi:MAG: accessory Sec system protein Asp3 [Micrococcales bacterium]|nr:accessory Sec system protein Asp3 [Micrococcales bacterium]
MSRKIATVGWGSPNSRASLHGTALTMSGSGETLLVNNLMPSGTTMQQWHSFTDYQSERDIPALPPLFHGKTYSLEPTLEATPPGSVFFCVRFFDGSNQLLQSQVLFPPNYRFQYPAKCHHYWVQLVNAGCDQLSFESLVLWEVLDHAE